jgi:autophagy-related protein 11
MAESPSSTDNPFRSPVIPSPEQSITDAISSTMNSQSRPRTASYHAARASPLASSSSQATVVPPSDNPVVARPASTVTANAFANLASSFGVSFSRKKKAELGGSGSGSGTLTPTVESPIDASAGEQRVPTTTDANSAARDLLRRF